MARLSLCAGAWIGMVMNRKQILTGLLLLVSSYAAWAFLSHLFPGWGGMLKISQDVLLVKCRTSPTQMLETNRGLVYEGHAAVGRIFSSDVEVVSVLKGRTVTPGSQATLQSEYWPYQGEMYLVFTSEIDGTNIVALDDYRVVPLGHLFSTNDFAGKTLDEQIKVALQYRLWYVNREFDHVQAEKQRLDEFLKK
jgi:hypothetical protein